MIALRDADRLEAIGPEGIRRCQVFTESRGGKVPEDVVVHCHEKLLRLYNEHFICTEEGRRLVYQSCRVPERSYTKRTRTQVGTPLQLQY